jgi:hypothetical protein
MNVIPKNETLTCIYCKKNQEHPAIDYIPFIPNLHGLSEANHNQSIQEEQCVECDSFMYLKLNDDQTISIAKTPQF